MVPAVFLATSGSANYETTMNEASLTQLFSNRCPRCGDGRIMSSLLEMNEKCALCELPFIQEVGQHWGAMVLSYAFGAVVALPIFLILLTRGASPFVAVGAPTIILAAASPFTVRFTRLAWMHVMYFLNPPKADPQSR